MSLNYVSFGAVTGKNMAQFAQKAVFSTDQPVIPHAARV
jgi:hypothetical protein